MYNGNSVSPSPFQINKFKKIMFWEYNQHTSLLKELPIMELLWGTAGAGDCKL